MLISLLLGWVAALCCVITALKFIARVSGNRRLNRGMHRVHIPCGVILLAAGAAHGLFAGNPSSATVFDFQPAAVLFTLNWGTACLVMGAATGVTYLLRARFKKQWMWAHRVATVALLLCLVLHLVQVGIQLPGRLFGAAQSEPVSAPATSQTQEGTEDTDGVDDDVDDVDDDETEVDSGGALVTFSGAALADGVYQGSAEGYNGTITVSVTVTGGQVSQIEVVSQSDTDRFFAQAQGVLEDVLAQQSLEVDTVSGATFSSAGLLNATYAALQGAVTSGELQIQEIDLSAIPRRGGH